MNLEMLKSSNRIIFECVSGSHAYGTNNHNSDIDIRGFYINPASEYLTLSDPIEQVSDTKNDITYYGLKKAFDLLIKANPNMIELLWMPDDCVRIKTPAMDKLIANRDLFVSKKCFHTHSGYAVAQIDKAKGQNKKVHNPQPEERPKKEDFCWIIPAFSFDNKDMIDLKILPCRPIPIKECVSEQGDKFDLNLFHCSALEYVENTYRLYFYGKNAKGVFRGDDMLVCESIPLDDEVEKFGGLLIYKKVSYERACAEWHSYWDWMKNRNQTRWIDQENGKLNYDQKNMMHCMRLLMSGENMLINGFPLVRFKGEQQKYLMKIRAGEFKYEEIMSEVEERMKKMEELYKTSTIPHSVNMSKIGELYKELANV